MILVTGATGTVGRPLVELIADWGPEVRAVTRDAGAAGLPAHVETVEADLAEPGSAAAGLAGADGLFLHPAAVPAPGALLRLAREAGVRRVVLLSGLRPDGPTERAEQAVAHSGLEWVVLRPGGSAAGARRWAAQIRAGNVVRGPFAEPAQSPLDPRDLAAVAAVALLTDRLVGCEPQLTGPQSLSPARMVGIIGEQLGRPLRYREDPAAAGFAAARREPAGRPALVTNEVERALGRPAFTFADWVADHLGLFR